MSKPTPEPYWFSLGKEARANGRPRELRDARVSRAHRAEWLAGWDWEQARRTAAQATPEQRQEAARVAAQLNDWAKTL